VGLFRAAFADFAHLFAEEELHAIARAAGALHHLRTDIRVIFLGPLGSHLGPVIIVVVLRCDVGSALGALDSAKTDHLVSFQQARTRQGCIIDRIGYPLPFRNGMKAAVQPLRA
jgi:hypothetical protein